MCRKPETSCKKPDHKSRMPSHFLFSLFQVSGYWFLVAYFIFVQSNSFSYSETKSSGQPTREELQALNSIRGKVKGQIVFQSRREPFWSIWKMNADGTGLKRLTEGNFNDRDPVWSSDGKRIYFISDRSGHSQIYSMDEYGGTLQNLSRSDKKESLCGVAIDGSKILFQSKDDGWMRVFLKEIPSGRVHEIDFSEFPGREGRISPMLSPDGKKIAFLFKSGRGAARSIYVGDLDESYRLKNIVPILRGCFSVWAKDSFHFIMCGFMPGGTALYLASSDGKELKAITARRRWNYFPAWSPDEKWFAWAASPTEFHDYESGPYDIYIASMTDYKPIRLTFDPAPDLSPSWRE